jgi:enoyl-CoA hydratase
MGDLVRLERGDDRVAVLTLDRPAQLNAIGSPTLGELGGVLDQLEGDEAVGAVVVAGEGKAFSAGADVAELDGLDGPRAFARFVRRFTDTYGRLARLPQPTIAAIHGAALGGGLELALACDLRVAAAGARLGVPEIRLGVLPAAGGTARLTKMLPPAVAKQLLMTGEPLTAADAHRLGLVNLVVPDDQVLVASCELAARLAAGPPRALAAAKRLVDDGASVPLDAAIMLERETVAGLFGTADRAEGTAAFLAKRPPSFHGR